MNAIDRFSVHTIPSPDLQDALARLVAVMAESRQGNLLQLGAGQRGRTLASNGLEELPAKRTLPLQLGALLALGVVRLGGRTDASLPQQGRDGLRVQYLHQITRVRNDEHGRIRTLTHELLI